MAPIHDAARAGDVEALRRELERGVSPDTDEYGMTPLFTAAHRNNANCIPLLLRAGADPNASMNGISALIMAASYGSRDAVCMLLQACLRQVPSSMLKQSGVGRQWTTPTPVAHLQLFARYYFAPAPSFHERVGQSATTHT